MKVTYLVQKRQEDGTTRLETVSHNEWVGLIREKSGLPKAQRRFFIKECIQENGEIDCMYIEVPYEVYKQWNCEHMRSERNRKSSQDIQFFLWKTSAVWSSITSLWSTGSSGTTSSSTPKSAGSTTATSIRRAASTCVGLPPPTQENRPASAPTHRRWYATA